MSSDPTTVGRKFNELYEHAWSQGGLDALASYTLTRPYWLGIAALQAVPTSGVARRHYLSGLGKYFHPPGRSANV